MQETYMIIGLFVIVVILMINDLMYAEETETDKEGFRVVVNNYNRRGYGYGGYGGYGWGGWGGWGGWNNYNYSPYPYGYNYDMDGYGYYSPYRPWYAYFNPYYWY